MVRVPAGTNLDERTRRIAGGANHRVVVANDGVAECRQPARDRVDQERHVVDDDLDDGAGRLIPARLDGRIEDPDREGSTAVVDEVERTGSRRRVVRRRRSAPRPPACDGYTPQRTPQERRHDSSKDPLCRRHGGYRFDSVPPAEEAEEQEQEARARSRTGRAASVCPLTAQCSCRLRPGGWRLATAACSRYGTTSTGQGASWTTWFATEPTTILLNRPAPRRPTTRTSASTRLHTSMSRDDGSPISSCVS